MPSNEVQINGYNRLTWEVPDSKMEELFELLNKIGRKLGGQSDEPLVDKSKVPVVNFNYIDE